MIECCHVSQRLQLASFRGTELRENAKNGEQPARHVPRLLLPSTFQAPILSIHQQQPTFLTSPNGQLGDKVSNATLSDNVATVSLFRDQAIPSSGIPPRLGDLDKGNAGCTSRRRVKMALVDLATFVQKEGCICLPEQRESQGPDLLTRLAEAAYKTARLTARSSPQPTPAAAQRDDRRVQVSGLPD